MAEPSRPADDERNALIQTLVAYVQSRPGYVLGIETVVAGLRSFVRHENQAALTEGIRTSGFDKDRLLVCWQVHDILLHAERSLRALRLPTAQVGERAAQPGNADDDDPELTAELHEDWTRAIERARSADK